MSETSLHFVQITFEPLSGEEMEMLLAEDERLNGVLDDPSIVQYDGFERGTQDFVMYFYGADANKMTPIIFLELRHLPFCDRATVRKRFGDHGSPEEIVRQNS